MSNVLMLRAGSLSKMCNKPCERQHEENNTISLGKMDTEV